MTIAIRTCSEDDYAAGIGTVFQYFGTALDDEGVADFRRVLPPDRVHAAFDGKDVVGTAGAYPFEMTIPGGRAPTAGIAVVGVSPTHRRKGILTGLMKQLLENAHERSEPLAALWVAEETIYGRFGCGVASITGEIRIDREHAHYRRHWDRLEARQISHEEALESFPPVYERVAPASTGMLSRSRDWWEVRQLGDREHDRTGAGPLVRVLFRRDSEPVGYALYRHRTEWREGRSASTLEVKEAIGIDPGATAGVWRYLLDIDLTAQTHTDLVPIDHPLFFLLAEPRRLRYRVADGIWVRLVDVEAALRARSYASDEQLVLEVRDSFCPWNEGCYLIAEGETARAAGEPDLRLDVRELASVYLGGFSFAQLARSGLVDERRPGGIASADRVFTTPAAPWCPEMF